MSRHTSVARIDLEELPELPQQALDFWRRARIVDATVREIAQQGYGQTTVAGIAERAQVSRWSFYAIFDGKEEALIWAYDAACAYVMPQILKALRSEDDWQQAAAAALATYLAILDCDQEWAVACLQEMPAAGEQARAARDALRAPVVDALQQRIGRQPYGVSIDTVLAGLDAVVVDGLRHRPGKPLWARRRELTSFVLSPFAGQPTDVGSGATAATPRPPADPQEIETLLDGGPAAQDDFALLVKAAVLRRDGPTLWRAALGLAQRRAAGQPIPEGVAGEALAGLHDAWFFGLPVEHEAVETISRRDRRYLRHLDGHPGSSGESVRRGLGIAHLSQVNRDLRRLEAAGLLRRTSGPGRANAWALTSDGYVAVQPREAGGRHGPAPATATPRNRPK